MLRSRCVGPRLRVFPGCLALVTSVPKKGTSAPQHPHTNPLPHPILQGAVKLPASLTVLGRRLLSSDESLSTVVSGSGAAFFAGGDKALPAKCSQLEKYGETQRRGVCRPPLVQLQRLGCSVAQRRRGPLLWFHTSCLGELAAFPAALCFFRATTVPFQHPAAFSLREQVIVPWHSQSS